ncbi:MAG TPA: hypothetical protein VHJ39_16685 [Solirubrobacteraceae bacterium]|jgi:hypothetical protein|nr:hypothetical protein [Solirubrobacteraceae bacterium]
MGRLSHGLLAGAAGTTLLDIATYVDMAVRGRPASSVPAESADRLARKAGISLGEREAADVRRTAIGALLGYASGLSAGIVYGAVAPALGWLPQPMRAVGLGLGVMATTAVSNALVGTSDPRTWSVSDWVEDLVPHVAYGVGTVAAFDAMS